MKRLFALVFFLSAVSLFQGPALAANDDCGIPPGDGPAIPNGATADMDQIRAATRAVQDYSLKVQNYLNCMQLNQDAFFLNMNEDQRERWTDDFNALADKLTETENSLNEQIRIFNRRS